MLSYHALTSGFDELQCRFIVVLCVQVFAHLLVGLHMQNQLCCLVMYVFPSCLVWVCTRDGLMTSYVGVLIDCTVCVSMARRCGS